MKWLPMVLGALWLGIASPKALIFYSTGDPSYNTNAPTGTLANSGWQYVGDWYSFLGTAIAPNYFISAKHIGGNVGGTFTLNGTSYTTTAYFEHTNADFRIWRVRGTFPAYAPLYSRQDEMTRTALLIGRGTQRGAELNLTSQYNHPLKGWFWGAADGVRRWGQSVVLTHQTEGVTGSDMLLYAFNSSGVANQCAISSGDSGGAVFLNDQGTWKLAGTISATEGPYYTNTTSASFSAALFDTGGLYYWNGTGYTQIQETFQRKPQYYFSTRVSAYLGWIQSVISQTVPQVLSAPDVNGTYTAETAATVNPEALTITISTSAAPRFYRLQDTTQRRILTTTMSNGVVVMTYE